MMISLANGMPARTIKFKIRMRPGFCLKKCFWEQILNTSELNSISYIKRNLEVSTMPEMGLPFQAVPTDASSHVLCAFSHF